MFDSVMRIGRRGFGSSAPLLIGLGIGFLLHVLLPTVFALFALALLVLGFGIALIIKGLVVYRRRDESDGENAIAAGAIAGGLALLAASLYLASRLLFG